MAATSPKKLKRILITAGPTREMLDPVRFLSNLSTGEMGYAVARSARAAGYQVTLISGPTNLKPPAGVRFVPVISASDMQRACRRYFPASDALVMSAAVCDFTAARKNSQKIHRTKTREMYLMQTPDIVAGLGEQKGNRLVIGFCLETKDWLKSARRKIQSKNLDGIVANYYSSSHVPFGNRRINTAFMDRAGKSDFLRQKSKREIAKRLLKWLENLQEKRFSNKAK